MTRRDIDFELHCLFSDDQRRETCITHWLFKSIKDCSLKAKVINHLWKIFLMVIWLIIVDSSFASINSWYNSRICPLDLRNINFRGNLANQKGTDSNLENLIVMLSWTITKSIPLNFKRLSKRKIRVMVNWNHCSCKWQFTANFRLAFTTKGEKLANSRKSRLNCPISELNAVKRPHDKLNRNQMKRGLKSHELAFTKNNLLL